MDTAQPKGRLRAFLKHATVHISSAKDHRLTKDSASTYSIDDDGRSQRSSKSAKIHSKLRRLGRGIREWRSKRRRLHGDARSTISHTLGGKSFSSSDGSISRESFETEEYLMAEEDLTTEEDLTDEDEPLDNLVDVPGDHALKASNGGWGESPEEKLQLDIIHKEVALRKSPIELAAPRETRKEVQSRQEVQSSKEVPQSSKELTVSRKDVALSQTPVILPPPPVYDRMILEQYYGRLGAWVEFHWVPAHSGLPVKEIADSMAALSCWFARAAPHSVQDAGLVMPLKVLQLWKDTKSLHIVLSIKALEPASYGSTVGPVGARPGPKLLAQQPTAQGPRQLLRPQSIRLDPEVGRAVVNPSASFNRGDSRTSHTWMPRLQHQVAGIPMSQPPPALPQPQSKIQTKKKGKKDPAALERPMCTYCGNRGHLVSQCFEKFPEQKAAFPRRYASYEGRERLEKVFPGAFHALARLHPQLMPQPIHGQDSRYMFGKVGISPHLTPRQCAVWAVRYREAQPCCDAAGAQFFQDQGPRLSEGYRFDEAQGAQLD